MCYNTFVNSARFFRTQRTMRSRHALLLTPLESALASRSQLTENTATLSLSDSALFVQNTWGGVPAPSSHEEMPHEVMEDRMAKHSEPQRSKIPPPASIAV